MTQTFKDSRTAESINMKEQGNGVSLCGASAWEAEADL